MRRKSLTKDERKIQIVAWFSIRLQHDNEDYASMYEIARGVGLSPSSHLAHIIKQMVKDETLEDAPLERSGRFANSRGYRLKQGTFQRPSKRQLTINFHSKGTKQMEIFG